MPDLLPPKYEFAHGLCIHLHNEMVALVAGLEAGGHLTVAIPSTPGRPSMPPGLSAEAIFQWLDDNGFHEELGSLYIRSLLPALLADFCHFTLEALNSSRKCKLTVAYALLRKPLRECLFYLECLLADPDDFLSRFHGGPIDELALDERLRDNTAKAVVIAAASRIPLPERYDPELIFNLRYQRGFAQGFAPLFDQALHLITTFRAIRTSQGNLNFIFSDPESHESQWQHLYTRLPVLLSYSLDVALVLTGALTALQLPDFGGMILHRQIALALWLDDCALIRGERPTQATTISVMTQLALQCAGCNGSLSSPATAGELYRDHVATCPSCHQVSSIVDLANRAA